ncbi:hypothetical protein LCGC14_2758590 [marine sediment metagenome]|uniref:Uncharacterized protein n=1 Tax=marine sediment metagenome TaxID=412755 RepID=A0A0F9BRB4_9ZZZZ
MDQEHWKLRIGTDSDIVEFLVPREVGQDFLQSWQTDFAGTFLSVDGYSDSADRAKVSFCVRAASIVWMILVRLY